MTTPIAVTAMSMANCLGATTQRALDGAFDARDALGPSASYCELPFSTSLGVLPGIDHNIDRDGEPWPWGCAATRVARCALPAAREITEGARAAVARWGASRVAYLFASSTGGLEETERMLAPRAHLPPCRERYDYGDHLVDATSAAIAASFGAEGPQLAISTACSSSLKAVISASRMLSAGVADAVVIGCADSLCRTTIFGFHSLGLLAPTPTRPFSRERAGLSLGEGAAFVVLERQAERPLAWITGTGAASDTYHHTSPHPEGLGPAACMRDALAAASLEPGDIGYVSAHGTGTKANDAAEAAAIARVFSRQVPVTATKSLTGHTLGTAGLTSLVLAIESLRRQAIPGTPRAAPVDEALGVELVERTRSAALGHVMVNAFGFGGSNAAAVVSNAPRRPS